MKLRSLVIPVVILLFAVSTFPGFSFSLSSSITSNYNSISGFDESGFGLYQDVACNHPWNGPAFGKGIVEITKVNDKKTIQKDLDIDLSGGGTPVYLLIPEGSGISQVEFGLTYHSNGAMLPEGCYIIFTLKETSGGTSVGSYVVYLDGTSSSIPIPVSDNHTYLVEAELHVLASENVVIGSELPYFGVTFESDSGSFVNEENKIDFRYNLDDRIVIESDGFQAQQSTSPVKIQDGTAYEVFKKSDGHFGTSKKGTTAVIDVGVSSGYGYYIELDLGTPNGNNVNTFTVTVKTTAGIVLFDEKTFRSTDGQYVIIGIDGTVQGPDSISKGDIDPFISSELEITVNGVTGNNGQTYVDLYLVKVPIARAT